MTQPINYFITYLDDEGDRAVAFPQCWGDLDIARDWKNEVADECPGRDARVECLEFPIGATIHFGDCTATVPIQEMGRKIVIASGVVMGLPVLTGDRIYVAVMAQTQLTPKARLRPKKVIVYAGNIIGVDPPTIKPFEDGIFGGEPLA